MTIAAGSDIVAADGINLAHSVFAYAASSSGNDTYAITLTPAPTAYAVGQVFSFIPNAANTGGATLNVNALGAKTILKNYNQALDTGDILAGQAVRVMYDGTNFQLLSPTAQMVLFTNGTTSKNLADASTTQNIAHGLGKIPKKVRLVFHRTDGTGFATVAYNGTTKSVVGYVISNAAYRDMAGTDIILYEVSNNTQFQTGVITFDATNIIITWTKTNSPTGTYGILWEAETW